MRFILFTVFFQLCLIHTVFAESDAEFPQGWDKWPVHHSGQIFSADMALPNDLPPIVVETMKTYNWVNDGKGSRYNVRINPEKKASLGSHEYADGSTAVLELVDIKAILVTEHLAGTEQYGAYSFDGKDLSGAHKSLAPSVCTACHSGYGDSCIAGVCTKK